MKNFTSKLVLNKMNEKKISNYSLNWKLSFVPYGTKLSINFKEKQIDRKKSKELLKKIFEILIPKEIYLFNELKNQKGRDKHTLFNNYDDLFRPSSGEILFLRAKNEAELENKDEDAKEFIFSLISRFDRSEKPNTYIFKTTSNISLETEDNLKQLVLANDYIPLDFRFSLQFYKPMSLFGPIITETFIFELRDDKIKAQITKKGIKSKKDFNLNSCFKFKELEELFNYF